MKRIFVVYRENDLYEKIVPKISEWLKDYEISIIAFPSSVNEDELRMEINMRLEMFRNNIVISDATCYHIISREDEKVNPTKFAEGSFRGEKENPIQFTDTLDSLCDKAIMSACGAKFEKGYIDIENEMADVSEIISNLLEKIKNHGVTPKKIYVITENTGDHTPFCYWDNGVNDDHYSKSKYETDIVAPVIAKWFAKKFKNKVKIISALRNQEIDMSIFEKIDEPETWVIMDRHFAGKRNRFGFNNKSFFIQATVLRLPLFDFFKDIYKNEILAFSDQLLVSEKYLKKLIVTELNES